MSLRTFIKHLPSNPLLVRFSSLHSLPYLSAHPHHQNHHLSQPQQNQQDPYALMKEDPIQICSEIWVKSFSTPKSKLFSNLTGFLSKFDIWVLAYQRSVAHFTGSFPTSSAIHSQTLHHLVSLRNAVVKGQFQWNMKTELYIRSPIEKPITEFTSKTTLKKLLGSSNPPFQDRVVQEALLLILEPVFESRFSSKSHGFRLGRNAHTVIRTIRSNFAGYLWYLTGDLSEVLENVDKGLVMNCVEEVVKDKRVLEEAAKVPNYGHCGILSPLLANDSKTDSCHNPAWPEFVPSGGKEKTRKMDYIRFGGHFLIGIRGSREDAVKIREELIDFCSSKLGIMLDYSKVEIEHVSRGILFLDHVICHRVVYPTLHYTGTGGKTVSKKCVGTLLSVTASLPQCIRRFRRLNLLKGEKDPEPLPCTPMLYSSQAHTNSQMNKFLETMADWYRYADNRKKVVGFCAYVIRNSLAKLYAARYKLKSRAKVYKIASRSLSHPLRGKGNNVASEYSDLLKLGLVDAIEGVQFSHMSLIPNCDYTPFPRVWVPEHEQMLLEYIKLQDPKFFSELLKSIKTQGLSLPQNEISEIVWDFKTLGARRFDIASEKHP
uniref:Domain X domain-containing protein n=1 Tax=Chenopodium quinoa TaxID=63459 RepID=A0A803MIV7_CHEQI